MHLEKKIGKNLNHHAHLIEGDVSQSFSELQKYFAKTLKFKTGGNPDYWESTLDTFGINNARRMQEHASRKPIGEKQIFVISFNQITREAQNSLLKVLEDPTSDTFFFVLVASGTRLLPTLESRLFRVNLKTKNKDFDEMASDFLKSQPLRRIEYSSEIVGSRNNYEAIKLIDSIESSLYTGRNTEIMDSEMELAFRELAKGRKYLRGKGSSVKLVLEHLALVLPKV